MRQTLLTCLCYFITLVAYGQTVWEVDKKNDGITVYTRKESHSDYKAFKATVSLKSSLDQIIELLKDADRYKDWYGFTKTSKLLSREKNVQYTYMETIFPWPFSNRDMVYKMTIDTVNAGEVLISLDGISDYLPDKKGIVRMKKASGFIRLIAKDNNTDLIYQFHSEPGKSIPVWLANQSIAELPYKTLLGLKTVLKMTK